LSACDDTFYLYFVRLRFVNLFIIKRIWMNERLVGRVASGQHVTRKVRDRLPTCRQQFSDVTGSNGETGLVEFDRYPVTLCTRALLCWRTCVDWLRRAQASGRLWRGGGGGGGGRHEGRVRAERGQLAVRAQPDGAHVVHVQHQRQVPRRIVRRRVQRPHQHRSRRRLLLLAAAAGCRSVSDPLCPGFQRRGHGRGLKRGVWPPPLSHPTWLQRYPWDAHTKSTRNCWRCPNALSHHLILSSRSRSKCNRFVQYISKNGGHRRPSPT